MARKPAPPTFRLEQGSQPPDLKAVMLASACAAAALDSPSAARSFVAMLAPKLHACHDGWDERTETAFASCCRSSGHAPPNQCSRRLACAMQQAGELRDDIGFRNTEPQSNAICVHILSDAVCNSAMAQARQHTLRSPAVAASPFSASQILCKHASNIVQPDAFSLDGHFAAGWQMGTCGCHAPAHASLQQPRMHQHAGPS